MLSRRQFTAACASAALANAKTDLFETAAAHVRLTEKHRDASALWGRIAGNPAEKLSAELLVRQLKAHVDRVSIEKFSFEAWRSKSWGVRAGSAVIPSAMPAPFDARFADGEVAAPLVVGGVEEDWKQHRGKWIFLPVQKGRYAFASIVREKLLYQRAVEAGAAGLMFALDTPRDSTWRYTVPVDKPYAETDSRYPGGRRPIPCFSVDSLDADRVAHETSLASQVDYLAQRRWAAHNVVAYSRGQGKRTVAIFNHIDSFFAGACDNASGIAVLVGLAEQLAAIPRHRRVADIYLMGISAHHDSAAGFRDFLARDLDRAARISELILLEHLDAVDTPEGRAAGWPMPLNDQRVAYLGSGGWPEIRQALPALVHESKLMTTAPAMRDACIADLFVTCGKKRSFCLMNAPPFYHSDHDTLDKISGPGMQRAVDFHMKLLRVMGAII